MLARAREDNKRATRAKESIDNRNALVRVIVRESVRGQRGRSTREDDKRAIRAREAIVNSNTVVRMKVRESKSKRMKGRQEQESKSIIQ